MDSVSANLNIVDVASAVNDKMRHNRHLQMSHLSTSSMSYDAVLARESQIVHFQIQIRLRMKDCDSRSNWLASGRSLHIFVPIGILKPKINLSFCTGARQID